MAKRVVNKLKALQLNRLSKIAGHHADGNGLYFEVRPVTLCAWWALRYKINGSQRSRYYSLGPWPRVSLVEARDLADAARALIRLGRDPVAERNSASGEMNFAELVAAFMDKSERIKKLANPKHREQWATTLGETLPKLGNMKPRTITAVHVWGAIAPVCERSPETGSRLRARVEAVFDYGQALGLIAGDNPARLELHRDHMKARVKKHVDAMPYADVPAFMAKLVTRDSMSARALELTILTAVRTGDTIGATWSEIDLAAKVWTIPAARLKIKSKGDHRVPLCDRAVEILKALPKRGDLVFPLSNMAMLNLLKGMAGAVTVHGFRSAFMDWASETTDHPKEVRDMALAHVVSDKVEAAYRRGDLFDKRVRLMSDWSAFIG